MSIYKCVTFDYSGIIKDALQKENPKGFLHVNPETGEHFNIVLRCLNYNSINCLKYLLEEYWEYNNVSLVDKIEPILDICSCKYIDKSSLKYLKRFIKTPNEANLISNQCDTPIHVVIENSKPISLKFLLDSKADIETRNIENMTPLIHAVYNDFTGCVETLIEYKANINAVDIDNTTALYYAVCNDDYNNVELLVDANANPNIRCKKSGMSVLEYIKHYTDDYESGARDKSIMKIFKKCVKKERKRKLSESVDNNCPICLDILGEEKGIKITKCLHAFHKKCWKLYDNKSKCPICRGVAI